MLRARARFLLAALLGLGLAGSQPAASECPTVVQTAYCKAYVDGPTFSRERPSDEPFAIDGYYPLYYAMPPNATATNAAAHALTVRRRLYYMADSADGGPSMHHGTWPQGPFARCGYYPLYYSYESAAAESPCAQAQVLRWDSPALYMPAERKGTFKNFYGNYVDVSAAPAAPAPPPPPPAGDGSLAVGGNAPLYRTAAEARAASPNQHAHSMVVGGEILWMPSAVKSTHDAAARDLYHGDLGVAARDEPRRGRVENELAADPISPFGRAEPFEYGAHGDLYYSIDAAKYASPKGAGYAVTVERHLFYKPEL